MLRPPGPLPPANSGPDRRGYHPGPLPMTVWAYAATAPPRCPGRHKIADVVQLLATPGKRPAQGLRSPYNSGIILRLCLDGTRKPTQSDNIGGRQMIPPKNKPFRTPLEPPHGQDIKSPPRWAGQEERLPGLIWAKRKALGKSGGLFGGGVARCGPFLALVTSGAGMT